MNTSLPGWITAQPIIFYAILGSLLLFSIGTQNFLGSPEFYWNPWVIVGNLLSAVLLVGWGLAAITASYNWAATRPDNPEAASILHKYDADGGKAKIKSVALILVAVLVTMAAFYGFGEPAMLHGVAPRQSIDQRFRIVSVTHEGARRSLCLRVKFADESGDTYGFCAEPSYEPKLTYATWLHIVGTRSWFGIAMTRYTPE